MKPWHEKWTERVWPEVPAHLEESGEMVKHEPASFSIECDGKVIGRFCSNDAEFSPERTRLAMAAPDLYLALDEAQKMIAFMREQCLLHQDTKHATEHAHDVQFEALNALRKARGE